MDSQPRHTLSEKEDEGKTIEIRRKVLRRFYEPVLLLATLGRVRGPRIKAEESVDIGSASLPRLRRSFLDGIAYVCAYKKTSDFVTAAGIEKTPQGLVVWLAANGGIEQEVQSFAEDLLESLHILAITDCKTKRNELSEQALPLFLAKVVAFNSPRLKSYFDDVVLTYVEQCLKVLRTDPKVSSSSKISLLCQWLNKNFMNKSLPEGSSLYDFVEDCHLQRKIGLFEPLKLFAGQGQTLAFRFEKLHEILCKLGKHATVTRKLINAAVHLAQDFSDGFMVKKLPLSKQRKLPLTPKEATVESIVRRMFSTEEEQKKFWTRLKKLWNEEEISKVLKLNRQKMTKVHAELILVDHFYKNGCQFLDADDPYIGCSKAACYLCHMYIVNHPGRFMIPASHQKLYPAWRVPDVLEKDSKAYQSSVLQERILLKMIESVRAEIVREMDSRASRPAEHPDSTAGITSNTSALHRGELSHSIDQISLQLHATSLVRNEFKHEVGVDDSNMSTLTAPDRAIREKIKEWSDPEADDDDQGVLL